MGERATELYEGARAYVAEFLGAKSADEVVFLRNATEALNLVAEAWGRPNLGPKDRIVTTIMEHHSNFLPWQRLARQTGAELVVLPVTGNGQLDMEAARRELQAGASVLAVTMVSNVLGTVNPIACLAAMAHAQGAVVVVDGAQAVAHRPVNVTQMEADFFVFSGHKAYAPTGIGVLWGRSELLAQMEPFLVGGEMVNSVSLKKTTFLDPPHRFEAGTPAVAEAIALKGALEYIKNIGFDSILGQEAALLELLLTGLGQIPGVSILGPEGHLREGLVSFLMDGVHPHDISGFLGEKGIAVRAGFHCAQPLHEALGIPATVRASIGIYNTEDDVRTFLRGLEDARALFTGERQWTTSTASR